MTERIQKFLARAGVASRREIEQWIRDGRIVVNGQPAQIGQAVSTADHIVVDGRPLAKRLMQPVQRRVLQYHKPVGEVTSRKDPEGRPTVFDHLPRPHTGRWVAIGRLDLNTSGLLLLTTDGELANRLMHPSTQIEREYAVRILGEVSPEVLQRLQEGVELEDGPARFEQLQEAGGQGANHWYHVTLKEGRNREVRRMWESQGVVVSRLMRIRYGTVRLSRRLSAGRWQELEESELNELLQAAGLEVPSAAPQPKSRRDSPVRKTSGARDAKAATPARRPARKRTPRP